MIRAEFFVDHIFDKAAGIRYGSFGHSNPFPGADCDCSKPIVHGVQHVCICDFRTVVAKGVKSAMHRLPLSSVEEDGLDFGDFEKSRLLFLSISDDTKNPDAFVDQVPSDLVSSSDIQILQSRFWSGFDIDYYRLYTVVRALKMPIANLLSTVKDVGLNRTIKEDVVVQTLLLLHRARIVLVVFQTFIKTLWKNQIRDIFAPEPRIFDALRMKDFRWDYFCLSSK